MAITALACPDVIAAEALWSGDSTSRRIDTSCKTLIVQPMRHSMAGGALIDQPQRRHTVAKGQKRSNREPRKPKQSTPKPTAAPRTIFKTADHRAKVSGVPADQKPAHG
jgi:hypothetical protein